MLAAFIILRRGTIMQLVKWLKRSLILIPVAIGIAAIVVVAPKIKKTPQKIEAVEPATKVRIIKPLFQEVSPVAVGYGSTNPSRSWDAVAEVTGRVVWTAKDLQEGKLITEGTELLKLDASDYNLALSQINAQLNTSKVKADTTNRSLTLEKRNRASLKKELVRQQVLTKKGVLPASTMEAAERNLIKADSTIQNLKNSLSINAAEKQVLNIQRQQLKLDLARTKIFAPFDVRIVSISAHEARFANKGQLLFSADATDKTEIEARFPIGQLRPLIASSDAGSYPGVLKLDAVVRLRTTTHTIEWQAKVERVAGQIDRQTQTSGVIVSVDDPYGKAQPGQRPPLSRNTFVEVELRGKPKDKQIIVPVSALHEGKVYVLNDENRLDIRKVKIAFSQGRYAVLSEGVEAEEKIVVSDLIPAIQNMLLEPIMDKKTRGMLMTEVTGKKPIPQKPSTPKESGKAEINNQIEKKESQE